MSADPSDAGRPPVVAEVVRGTPTEEELAAAIVVVSEAYVREVAEATAPDDAPRSRWELSARGLRTPLNRAAGWNGFTG
ncbi:acyl-CoA carboxylase subunit epsilon [Microbacterium sp. KSW2-29]|uniref:Acyl-CoA carboxylase subunit epsilon n=1 Tax=Microbacterium phycohabitans TaxID=3075993 RepID=A0ABU3SI60_9MICO|nr:acyl-CoA carboxylase subunit epsilon [Microbacterium sp. KSW2-29]MDU0344446.1 acyl-CoA carboxylase subunit epsilon [Microbacterium sp. KSW2-29]